MENGHGNVCAWQIGAKWDRREFSGRTEVMSGRYVGNILTENQVEEADWEGGLGHGGHIQRQCEFTVESRHTHANSLVGRQECCP